MPKTTYYAEAPDGSIHTRKSDRTYTHGVLVLSDGTWGLANCCARLDLAQKKTADHQSADEVAVVPLTTEAPSDQPAEIVDTSGQIDTFEPAEADSDEPESAEEPSEKPKTMGQRILEVAMDPTLSNKDIAAMMAEEFPGSAPTHKSVASVICVANKKGANIPKRQRKPKVS